MSSRRIRAMANRMPRRSPGAVGGAVAGSAIQKNMNKAQSYNVYVRMDNGNTVTLNQADVGGIREGSYVRVYNGRAWVN